MLSCVVWGLEPWFPSLLRVSYLGSPNKIETGGGCGRLVGCCSSVWILVMLAVDKSRSSSCLLVAVESGTESERQSVSRHRGQRVSQRRGLLPLCTFAPSVMEPVWRITSRTDLRNLQSSQLISALETERGRRACRLSSASARRLHVREVIGEGFA